MTNNDFDFDFDDFFSDDDFDFDSDFDDDSGFGNDDLSSELPLDNDTLDSFGDSKPRANDRNVVLESSGIQTARAELEKLREEWKEFPEVTLTSLRALIVRTLALFGDPSVIEVVRPLLAHSQDEVRVEALRAVARLGDRTVVPDLFAQLEVEEKEEALETLDTLLAFDDREMIPALLRYLRREDGVPSDLLKRTFAKFGAWADTRTIPILEEYAEKRVVLKSSGADSAAKDALAATLSQWLKQLGAAAAALKWVESADLIPRAARKPESERQPNSESPPPVQLTSVEWGAPLITGKTALQTPADEDLDAWVSTLNLPPTVSPPLKSPFAAPPTADVPDNPFSPRPSSSPLISASTAYVEGLLREGINAFKDGNKDEARTLILKVVDLDPYHEQGWLWLSGLMDSPEDQITCLENVLAINPNNERAQNGMAYLRSHNPTLDNPFSAANFEQFDWSNSPIGADAPEPEETPYDYANEIAKLKAHPIRKNPLFGQILALGKYAALLLETGSTFDEDELVLESPEFATADARIAALLLLDALDELRMMANLLVDKIPEVRFAAAVLLHEKSWRPAVTRGGFGSRITQKEFDTALNQRREESDEKQED